MDIQYSDQKSQTRPEADGKILSDDLVDNVRTQAAIIPEESGRASSPSAVAETLLRALRNVIIPLVRPGDAEYKHDASEGALGPGGEEFVIALQKFMSSFLRSQHGPVGGIEVAIPDQTAEIPSPRDSSDDISPEPEPVYNAESPGNSPSRSDRDLVEVAGTRSDVEPLREGVVPEELNGSHDQPEGSEPIQQESSTGLDPRNVMMSEIDDDREGIASIQDPSEEVISLFRGKLLKALHQHVFNVMPIRLLCFKPHATKLQITLIERSEIYAQIVLNIENSISYADEYKRITALPDGFSSVITTGGPVAIAEMFLIGALILKYSRYAILSHTWIQGSSGEVTYGDWNRGEFDVQQPGYIKLVNFCKAAWENHGVAFGWMDTVCINKESSAELDESIRSMYKWYGGADVCITYLAETIALSDMPNDRWFTRGWTLQELFAPSHVKFYNADWIRLVDSLASDKSDTVIVKQIEDATTITGNELRKIVTRLPISRRMQLAAKRQVTREEDSAYCLMGIFDVSMSIAYGEGAERALARLLEAILNLAPNVLDIFNWAGFGGSRTSSLLPPSLQSYLHRSSHIRLGLSLERPIEPLTLTHLGLRVFIVLIPAISIRDPNLKCGPIGDYHAIAHISPIESYSNSLGLDDKNYSVLDDRISGSQGRTVERAKCQVSFGILNVQGGQDTKIWVPHHCLAVGLFSFNPNQNAIKIPTEKPIIFTLNKRPSPDGNDALNHDDWNDFYSIERSELVNHGMKLVTLYL